MKKHLLFLFILAATFCATAQSNYQSQIILEDFREARSTPNVENWPKDANGNMDCALIRVSIESIHPDELSKITFNFDQNTPAYPPKVVSEAGVSMVYIFVTPSDEATFIEAVLGDYGKSNRVTIPKLGERKCYDVRLRNNKRLSISFSTEPTNAIARIETGEKTTTPGTIANVLTGRHYVTLSLNGKTLLNDTINVTESSTHFTYDLRTKKNVKFSSTPSGTNIYIDGELIGSTPVSKELAYGSYQVEARKSINETDIRTININEYSETDVHLSPMQKKTLIISATYKNSSVKAPLYIDDELYSKKEAAEYRVSLPINKKFHMEMLHGGYKKSRTVKVKKDMSPELIFRITDKKEFVWPWQRVYDVRPFGIYVGYVSKEWSVSSGDTDYNGVPLWEAMGYDSEGNILNGIQAGFQMQPCFSWGGGIYTGAFLEFYYSSKKASDNPNHTAYNSIFDRYSELSLYIPAHLYYRLPFAEKVALSLHGGLGFDCGIYNRFHSSEDKNKEPYENFYGKESFPSRLNVSAEVGVGLRIKAIQINAQISKGLTNNGYIINSNGDKLEAVQNKLRIGLTYLISGDY